MTIDKLKRQLNAAVTPLVNTAGKYGEYAYVHINLSKGSSIMGFFPLEGDIDFDSIAAQAKSAESEGRENTLFIFVGTDIPEKAWEKVFSKRFQQNKCESIVIPQGVTKIGNLAFSGCSALTSVEIPNSVTEIGENAFSGCSSLTSVEIPNSVTSIGGSAFLGCSALTSVEIPNSVTEIGECTFYGCKGLTSVEIPNSVTEIGERAFYGCSGLTSVEIPNSVTKIGLCTFSYCSSLTSVEIPNSVTEIEPYAFSYCSSLTSVEIPNSVTKIGYSAFKGCTSLTFTGKFASDDHLCLIFNGILNSFIYTGQTSYSIPNSVTEIGTSAFEGCKGLTSVEIPNSVTEIGNSAFSYCSSLTSVEIPNSVTKIEGWAFKDCSGLTSVEIPNSVTEIGMHAFANCYKLQQVSIANKNMIIGQNAFEYCYALTEVELPEGMTWSEAKKDFQFTPWGSNGPENSKTKAEKEAEKAYNDYIMAQKEAKEAKKEAKEAKEEKLVEMRVMSLETMARATFSPHDTSVTIGETTMKVNVSLANDSFIVGSFRIDKKKDYKQIDWDALQASKAVVESKAATLYVVGEGAEEYGIHLRQSLLGSGDSKKVKHAIFCDSIEWLPYFVLSEYTSLEDVEIPSSVTSIHEGAFRGCTSLYKLQVPDNVTSIASDAFENCISLSFDSLHYSLNGGFLVNKDTKTLLKYIGNATEVTVPDGIEIIGCEAFKNNATLQSITLPASVMSIETKIDAYKNHATFNYNNHAAFDNCTALHTVVIGNPYVNIDLKAFRGCKAITNVDLPAGLTWAKIKNRFKECPWGQNKPTEPAKKAAPKAKTAGGKVEKDLRSMSITAAVKYIFEPYKANVSIEKNFAYYYLSITVPLQGNSIIYGLLGNADGEAFSNRKITINQIDIESLKAVKLQAEQEQLADTIYYIGNSNNNLNEVFNATQAKQLIITQLATCVRCEDCPTLERVVVTGVNNLQDKLRFYFKSCTALKDVVLAEGVPSIWWSAFEGCTALESIDLPKSVVSIDFGAFKGCTALKTINMPGVKELSSSVFDGCTALESIDLPKSVVSIGSWAFKGCTALKTINMPGVKELSHNVFYGCTALKLTLPSCLEEISAFSFNGLDLNECEFENEHFVMRNGMLISKAQNKIVVLYAHRMSVTSVTIPEGVTAIGYETFSGTALHSIVIPEAVTEIGASAFEGCKDLKKVVIQNPNTTFGEGAFGNCTALTEVELPKGMTWSKMKKYFKGSPWSEEKPKK